MFLGNTPRKQTPKMEVDCRGSTTCSFLNVTPLIHSKRFQKLASLAAISKSIPVELVDPQMLMAVILVMPTFINIPLLVYSCLSSPSCCSKSPQVATKKSPEKTRKTEDSRWITEAIPEGLGEIRMATEEARWGENGEKTLQFWRYTVIFKVMTLCWKFNHPFFIAWFMNHHFFIWWLTSRVYLGDNISYNYLGWPCYLSRSPDNMPQEKDTWQDFWLLKDWMKGWKVGNPKPQLFSPKVVLGRCFFLIGYRGVVEKTLENSDCDVADDVPFRRDVFL